MDWMQTELASTLQALSLALGALNPDAPIFPRDPRLEDLIMALPRLNEADIDMDAVCPICLGTLRAHLAEEEMASVMESPAQDPADLGVTRLHETCNHVFCRKDIIVWIRQGRNVDCPTCRTPLLSQDRLAVPLSAAPVEQHPLNLNVNGGVESDQTTDMLHQLVCNVLEQMRSRDSAQYLYVRRLLETAFPGIPLPPLPDNIIENEGGEPGQEEGEEQLLGREQQSRGHQEDREQDSSPTRDDFAGMYT